MDGPVVDVATRQDDNPSDEMDVDNDGRDEEVMSELSDGEDLRDDLLNALHDDKFSFDGNFYHASLLTTAPNPCVTISGLGLVGMPLSKRDAKSIISCATLAPFGHGERTVVDKEVRDTWEIEPSRIEFANKEWEKFVRGPVCAEVCRELGVAVGNSPPRMELYKLLLYETGSHFLPHQDTQKANGMFATVIILLPSAYTGGQVVVSHASTTRTINFAPNSFLSTALLAWYTDVKHEVKPVTSGYRLALSYNLIHTAPPGLPKPCLPQMGDSVRVLRRVLRKWKEAKYKKKKSARRLVAYLLNHEYSNANLHEGVEALKGVDAHRVTFLRGVAEQLGFKVGLASLEHHISGCGDDDGGSYHNRGRWDYGGGDEEETPGMLEVIETKTSISGLVDLDGSSLLPVGEIDLKEDALIPKDPFKDEEPDDTEYEGYMGNGAGQLDYWYRRTVLVLMHASEVDNICFSVAGIPYAFEKLKKSTAVPPTQEDRLWANRILQKTSTLNQNQIVTMLYLALKWKDVDMWKVVMKGHACTLSIMDVDKLVKAWKMFSFEAVRVSFEEIIARSMQLHDRINFIFNLRPQVSEEEKGVVSAWCKKESDKVLASYTTADLKDVPTIMSIIRVAGLEAFTKVIMPNLIHKQDLFPFWIAMIKALRDGKKGILERLAKTQSASEEPTDPSTTPTEPSPDTPAQNPTRNPSEKVVDDLIKTCLETAFPQWTKVTTTAPYRSYCGAGQNTQPVVQTTKIDRIIQLLEQALIIGDLDVCRRLFVDVLGTPGKAVDKFKQIYTPLAPRLGNLLLSKNIDLCTPPFVDMFQILIGTYLRDVLGKKGHLPHGGLRKIGCGCTECGQLDRFILDPTTTRIEFRLVMSRREHVEGRVRGAPDLCTFETIYTGRPYGVQITKRPEVVRDAQWPVRQKEAKAFLASIGSDELVQKIMGDRYADVVSAINGMQVFGMVRTAVSLPSVGDAPMASLRPPTSLQPPMASLQPPAASSSTQPAHATPNLAPGPVAGKKRKSGPVILGPVIDLTEEDSD
ncbi:unnamed protein product [Cyclocybe aegerita]|uniref:Prolyl 4-hydroxylase alpha subunit Fe(2+) 2OG dioxygenase domain-containing protein n=1 Tax=Cyclocybe aegerita TaxID=1973307 RepID=A0A8S0WA44_CYCAE|nr:unnamed protein product [Cyclocybe aegerita]